MNIGKLARRHVLVTAVLVAAVVASGALLAAATTTVPALEAPTITQEPADATDSGRAKFKLEHPRKDVTFECSLNGAPFTACHKNVQYRDLPPQQHCFAARALAPPARPGAQPLRSPATERCWTNVTWATFGISGTVTQPLHPGRSVPVDLRFANANNQDIRVLSVTVTVEPATTTDGSPNPGCDGHANLEVSRELQGPITVPKQSTRSLSELGVDPARWPELTMPNLAVNQDACKSTEFTLRYTGTATK